MTPGVVNQLHVRVQVYEDIQEENGRRFASVWAQLSPELVLMAREEIVPGLGVSGAMQSARDCFTQHFKRAAIERLKEQHGQAEAR